MDQGRLRAHRFRDQFVSAYERAAGGVRMSPSVPKRGRASRLPAARGCLARLAPGKISRRQDASENCFWAACTGPARRYAIAYILLHRV